MFGIAIMALLLCIPSMASAQKLCTFGNQVLNPGETFTVNTTCARQDCTCDPSRTADEMCKVVMTGCYHGDTDSCTQLNDLAILPQNSGSRLHCICGQNADGAFVYNNCRSETCRDSKTGEEKKKGESVTAVIRGITYECTCAGTDGYKECVTEESTKNIDKCLDHVSGGYVGIGATVNYKHSDSILQCTCLGTNSYDKCYSTTCKDDSGVQKQAGEKVTMTHGGEVLVCDCAGAGGYQNCQLKEDYANAGKCRANNGGYVSQGQRYRITYECTCDGSNQRKDCTVVRGG